MRERGTAGFGRSDILGDGRLAAVVRDFGPAREPVPAAEAELVLDRLESLYAARVDPVRAQA